MQPVKKLSNEKCTNISHQVNKLSRRLEALASAVNQLNQNSNAFQITEYKLAKP